MSEWQFGNYYRFKAVIGQAIIKELPNAKRTRCAEVLVECTHGPMIGQRLRFTGFINSQVNAARTFKDLREMGWFGKKWGEWDGLFRQEFEAKVMSDEARDGSGRVFPRVAFPRRKRGVDVENAVSEEGLASVNEEFGNFDELEAIAEAQEHDRKNGNGSGYAQPEDLNVDS